MSPNRIRLPFDISEIEQSLHHERLETVVQHLSAAHVRTVLDLGCGTGRLLSLLTEMPIIERIVGMDVSRSALATAARALGPDAANGKVSLVHASFTEPELQYRGFDAAVLVESIEHISPTRLSSVESTVFAWYQPKLVLITTPNSEYNVLHGMFPGQLRHPEHCFEWPRSKFRNWAAGVAERNDYDVSFFDIGPSDPVHGGSTQMARFLRRH